ncbi:cellulose synthesis protein [Agrobacterium albertimagni AOL15]|uniref:Cellulose synthesis protein n=1 Tax=Agrobacterium albertimagni AOL15 TaxID=1156935 RepID=K2QX46_9HYPH|nr:amidohydrolase [Agrobacterium albertimagni]EKF59962.1 cellulose synthesis protein [Agrobacterium albertimagni AOL15]
MFLTNRDVIELQAFRHELHRHPEVSGEEQETARRVVEALQRLAPSRIVTDLGGHGVAAVFDSGLTGPTLLIRAELDALPIEEKSAADHRSTIPGKGHLCGHDGHSTILLALARGLSRQPIGKGRVVLLWQPAEEDGSGAAAVLADPRFEEIRPDFAYSLHNMPGLAFGTVALKSGPVNCASRGMKIRLSGKTAHASQPETGISPMAAMSRLMPELTALSHGAPPSTDFTLATVTHATLGEQAFGIAPGDAEIWVTLRTLVDDRMADLCERAQTLVTEACQAAGLQHDISYHDIFFHCENAPEAVDHLEAALQSEGIRFDEGNLPMRASEDFGRLRTVCPSAMFFLGAGENHSALHNPDYDYPDDLTAIGARIFMAVIRKALG